MRAESSLTSNDEQYIVLFGVTGGFPWIPLTLVVLNVEYNEPLSGKQTYQKEVFVKPDNISQSVILEANRDDGKVEWARFESGNMER